jgi:hypothetical protein
MASLKDAKENFADLLDIFSEWFSVARHPIENCRALLAVPGERDRYKQIKRLWVASFVITLIVSLPLYHQIGIDLSTMGYHLANLLCFSFLLMVSAFTTQIGLRIYKVRAPFSDIAAMWTAFFACYQPIFAVLANVTALKRYTTLATAHRQGLDFPHAIAAMYSVGSAAIPGPLDFAVTVCGWLALAGNLVCATLMAITIAEIYSIPRQKSFSALAFALVLGCPFFLLPWFVSIYVMYAFSH